MCLYPKLIKNKKYISNKKNGGVIPAVKDERVLYVPIGCGRCIECTKQKANNWRVRLLEEIRNNSNYTFVTLTFSDMSLIYLRSKLKELSYNIDNDIATKGVRYFLELWRKNNKTSVRHWLITELGQNNTERIHLHGIIDSRDIEQIKNTWKWGEVHTGTFVNEKTINYIIKYVTKVDSKHKNFVPKILCSKGLGSSYLNRYDSNLNKFKGIDTKEYYRTRDGVKLALPIYYRNKIYKEEEKEILWLNKLDKEERFVLGEKVSVKYNEESYDRLVKYYREINKKLGYGDDSSNWDKKLYNRQKRIIKNLTKQAKGSS